MGVSKYDIDLDLGREANSSHWHVADLIGSAKRVLDVGCSTGYFAEALTARGNEVLGVEYDEASAESARSRGLEVLTGDLETLDLAGHFGPASFDVVVYADVLEHLRDPLPVLRRTHALLRPGGTVVISLPNIAHGDIRLALLDGRFDYTETGILDNTHTRFFTRSTLTRFARDAGFAVAELRRTTAPLFHTEQGLDPAAYDRPLVERVLADPEALTYQFVVKAVVDDGSASDLGLAEKLYEAQIERDRLGDETARLRQHVTHLDGTIAQLTAELTVARRESQEALAKVRAELVDLRERLERDRASAVQDIERLKRLRRRMREERDRLRAEVGVEPSTRE